MMHSQIDKEEIVERYVSNQLSSAERQAFQEHFFECEECFEKLQATMKLRAGIRDAAERGLLPGTANRAPAGGRSLWFSRPLALTTFAAVVFAALSAWMYFAWIPRLRTEARRPTAPLRSEQPSGAPVETEPAVEVAEANVPVVVLQATRAAAETTRLVVPPGARRIVLWVEIGPSRYHEFQLQVFAADSRVLTSITGLQPNRYGALAASLPAEQLPAGDFRIRLTGQNPPPAALAAEYHLKIGRK
jgi:Putative zinc-finger